jgi:PAT family beta-lactamase induction signal transducer AmpG
VKFLKLFLSRRMMTVFLLGFASGFPLAITGGTLKTWLKQSGVDLTSIGFFSWVGIAYSFKFLWAPFLDKYFSKHLGRRKTWMLVSQVGIAGGILALSQLNPTSDLTTMGLFAVVVAFFSATQDIAIDAYRREILPENELGIGSSINVYGYRLAMMASGGLAIAMVDVSGAGFTWNQVYMILAGMMGLCLLITLTAKEPALEGEPASLADAVMIPLKELFTRNASLTLLVFVILFKIGDSLSGAMLNPFYVDAGFSNQQIGYVVKTVGLFSSLAGLFLGGSLLYWVGTYRALWISGILQALSTAAFAVLTWMPTTLALTGVVVFEDVSSGMGTAAFVAFLGSITDRKYTAFQFALLSSLAGVGRTIVSGWSGAMAQSLGWYGFFVVCALAAIPGMLMLIRMKKSFLKSHASTLGT